MKIKKEIINGEEILYVDSIDEDEIEKNDEVNYEDTLELKEILAELKEKVTLGDSSE